MRQKKIRGHNRRHKQIENWRLDNLSLDLTDYLLNERDRHYAKIRVQDHYDNTEVGEPEIYASRQDYEDTVKWFDVQ